MQVIMLLWIARRRIARYVQMIIGVVLLVKETKKKFTNGEVTKKKGVKEGEN